MAHEIFESRVVGIGEVVDPLVQSDVAQSVVLNLCPTTRQYLSKGRRNEDVLAASMKPW